MQVPDDIQIIMGQLHFEADAHWVDGQYDRPEALVAAFKDQPGLEDYTDESDNVQSAVRLDVDPDGAEGFWVLVPKGTKTPCHQECCSCVSGEGDGTRRRDRGESSQDAERTSHRSDRQAAGRPAAHQGRPAQRANSLGDA
jgi:hypothetical protein